MYLVWYPNNLANNCVKFLVCTAVT